MKTWGTCAPSTENKSYECENIKACASSTPRSHVHGMSQSPTHLIYQHPIVSIRCMVGAKRCIFNLIWSGWFSIGIPFILPNLMHLFFQAQLSLNPYSSFQTKFGFKITVCFYLYCSTSHQACRHYHHFLFNFAIKLFRGTSCSTMLWYQLAEN